MIIAMMAKGKRPVLMALLLLLAAGCTSIQPRLNLGERTDSIPNHFDYSSYERLLARHVNPNGLVDYAGLSQHQEVVDRFYGQIAAYSPDSHPHLFPDDDDRLAYWINSYNLTTIKGVLHSYPITSVADVDPPPLLFFFPSKSGFFFFQRFTYGGVETNLYYLENKVIRKRFSDPRYHFGLNCASSSCPALLNVPFYPDRIDEQLRSKAVEFINDKNNVRYDKREQVLFLSAIFDWYEEDFLNWLKKNNSVQQPTIVDYILLYLNDADAGLINRDRTSLRIRYLPYDWALNDLAATPAKNY